MCRCHLSKGFGGWRVGARFMCGWGGKGRDARGGEWGERGGEV